jgi:hypothetical protein
MSEHSSRRTVCINMQTGRLHIELTGGPAGRADIAKVPLITAR